MTQEVEHLSNKREALSSNFSTRRISKKGRMEGRKEKKGERKRKKAGREEKREKKLPLKNIFPQK
jgi:hypothetical protein